MDISNAPNFASTLMVDRGTATTAGAVVAAASPDEAAMISRSNKKKGSAGAVDNISLIVFTWR